ncbi:MAG: hypothetical protein HY706_19240 [Candidatus Hydrogenedentes bacterium]|nr:hypothetical protein [Candidatus Hydrogenedentota bacterium]
MRTLTKFLEGKEAKEFMEERIRFQMKRFGVNRRQAKQWAQISLECNNAIATKPRIANGKTRRSGR